MKLKEFIIKLFNNDANNVKAFLAGLFLAMLFASIFSAMTNGVKVSNMEVLIVIASIGSIFGYYTGVASSPETTKTDYFVMGILLCFAAYFLGNIDNYITVQGIIGGFSGFLFSFLAINSGLIKEKEILREGFNFIFEDMGSYAFTVYIIEKFVAPILLADTILRIAVYIVGFIIILIIKKLE